MTLAELAVTANDFGLDADTIVGLARPGVVLRPHAHPVGDRAGSWLGGLPSLPSNTVWPASEGHALAFIAQVACDDLPLSLLEEGFPERYSPKDGCHAQDGEVLIVKPKTPLPSKDTAHHFVSATDGRTKSTSAGSRKWCRLPCRTSCRSIWLIGCCQRRNASISGRC
jgi:hypothetical protein